MASTLREAPKLNEKILKIHVTLLWSACFFCLCRKVIPDRHSSHHHYHNVLDDGESDSDWIRNK
jgi:coproporphyrinogen III oxidase-like Fe-S oxidoreductase